MTDKAEQIAHLTHTECPHCGGTNCQEPDEAILQDIFDKMAEVVAPLPRELSEGDEA